MICNTIRLKSERYLGNELDRQERNTIEMHLLHCEDCRLEIDRIRKFDILLDRQSKKAVDNEVLKRMARNVYSAIEDQNVRMSQVSHFINFRLLPTVFSTGAVLLVFLALINLGWMKLSPLQEHYMKGSSVLEAFCVYNDKPLSSIMDMTEIRRVEK